MILSLYYLSRSSALYIFPFFLSDYLNGYIDRERLGRRRTGIRQGLRSKRFRLVSEQRKTEEGDFRFWPREKWNESQKTFRAVFDSRSSLFAPNRTETRMLMAHIKW